MSSQEAPDAHSLAERLEEWAASTGGLMGKDMKKAAALLRQMAAPGWRPISEMPPKKICILATPFYHGEILGQDWRVQIGSFHPGMLDEPWYVDGRYLKDYDAKPTHWMPLPSAPTGDAK